MLSPAGDDRFRARRAIDEQPRPPASEASPTNHRPCTDAERRGNFGPAGSGMLQWCQCVAVTVAAIASGTQTVSTPPFGLSVCPIM